MRRVFFQEGIGEYKALVQIRTKVVDGFGVDGFRILKFLKYIRDELLIVLGTASSETVLPNLMRKLALQTQTDLVRFAIRKGLIQA